MKATMESTDKLFILQGLNFRVWEGTSEMGTKFIALVNRCAAVNALDGEVFILDTMKKHKAPEPATLAALAALGIE